MAHIIEFTIEGLAGRNTTYSKKLNRDVNVFFGLNGSGKTSLLKILHSAMTGDATILKNVPFKKAEVKLYSVDYAKFFTRTIEHSKKGNTISTGQELLFITENELNGLEERVIRRKEAFNMTWKTKPNLPPGSGGSWAHGFLPTSRFYLRGNILSRGTSPNYLSDEVLDDYFAKSLEALWASYNADILAAVRKAQEDGLASILKAVLSSTVSIQKNLAVENITTAYNRVASFLRRQGSPDIIGSLDDFEERYQKNVQLRSVVSDINEIEKKIELATFPKEKLQNLIQKMFSENKEVRFDDRTISVETLDNENIGLQTLSSGEKQVLRIFIETLLADVNSIIIDEPELSMHVDWQRQLVSDMQLLNPKTQIILATHSPEIMADIDDDRIFRL